jgi:F0F1-type ATP synthase assembly protein I
MKNSESREVRPPDLPATASRYYALGLEMAFSVIIGFAVGYLLDRELHTLPWFTLAFTVLGVAAAYVSVYRAVRDLKRSEEVRWPKH